MNFRERIKTGSFNYMSVECKEDGSQVITLKQDGDPQVYQAIVRNPDGPDETVVYEDIEEAD